MCILRVNPGTKCRQLEVVLQKLEEVQKSDTSVINFLMFYYGKDELADKSACAVQRADLKLCLLMSDCVIKKKKTPRQCLLEPEGMVPDECFAMKNAFFECKRSLIDMRARFRGIKN